MQKVLKYVVFRTKWGHFGLAGTESGLCRTQLPGPRAEEVKALLLKNFPAAYRKQIAGPHASELGHQEPGIEYQTSIIRSRDPKIEFDKTFFKSLQEQITAYFEGARVDFGSDIHIVLDGLTGFRRAVLATCRSIKYCQTRTYGRLAEESGQPAAARAVGGALAKNPLPLIIPCHRVVRSDGRMGGFSAPGGISLKKKMLDLERQALHI